MVAWSWIIMRSTEIGLNTCTVWTFKMWHKRYVPMPTERLASFHTTHQTCSLDQCLSGITSHMRRMHMVQSTTDYHNKREKKRGKVTVETQCCTRQGWFQQTIYKHHLWVWIISLRCQLPSYRSFQPLNSLFRCGCKLSSYSNSMTMISKPFLKHHNNQFSKGK